MPTSLKGRSLVRLQDWTPEEIRLVLEQAERLKARQRQRAEHSLLEGRTIALLFEKPSTRTRISFVVAMQQLGGHALDLSMELMHVGKGGEPIRDTALVMSRYVDAIVVRAYRQSLVDELARWAEVPVINGLSDAFHPCQALADVLTIRERFDGLEGVRVAYLGDGDNNVTHSLMTVCAKLGVDVVVASPPGYEPRPEVVGACQEAAARAGSTVRVVHDPREAATGADVLYTDVWTSMGKEDEQEARRAAFSLFGVDEALLALASERAVVMHCLPARCGEEITEGVLYGPRSAVWDQAENRLHAQKGLLALVVR
ncbi:MAG: ornithine carbamoyltransferase [Thermoleophilia bacterium]